MPQKTTDFPAQIDKSKLPVNVGWDRRGRGAWRFRRSQGRKNRGKSIRLGGAGMTLAEIWQAVERLSVTRVDTLDALRKEFEDSSDWKDLKPTTQKDYENCRKAICATKTRSGIKLEDLPLTAWTPGAVRRYRDQRQKSSPSRASSEVRYLKRLFGWAVEYEYMRGNPASGIKPKSGPPRLHYVSDGEYQYVLDLARSSGSPYLAHVMELAYMCRLRVSEVLDITRDRLLDEGLLIRRRKGSKDAIVEWSDRLRAAVKVPGKKSTRWVFVSASGGRLAETTVQTAWQRLMKKAVLSGLQNRFTLHDLKRKGISDYQGDKLAASGHRSMQMLKIYDVLPASVKPTEK